MIDRARTRRPGGGFCARMVPAGAAGSSLVPLTMRPKWIGITNGAASARVFPIRFGTRGWPPSHARPSTTAPAAREAAAITAAATPSHLPLLRGGTGGVGSSGGISLARILVEPLAARQPRQLGGPGRPARKRDDGGEGA